MNKSIIFYDKIVCHRDGDQHKLGYRSDTNKVRYQEYRRNPADYLDELATVPFDDSIFRLGRDGSKIFFKKKILGRNRAPDEFVQLLITDLTVGRKVKNYTGEDSKEVFIFDLKKVPNPGKWLKDTISLAIKHNWDYDVVRKELSKNKPSFIPYFHQAWILSIIKDIYGVSKSQYLIEFLCPRIGKTLLHLYQFLKSDKEVFILMQYYLSPAKSFEDDLRKYSDFADIDYIDLTDSSITVDDLPLMIKGKKTFVVISLCGDRDRKKLKQFITWANSLDPKVVTCGMDEADFGSLNDNQQIKWKQICPQSDRIVFTGTGLEKIVSQLNLVADEVGKVIDVDYLELLLMKKGTHFSQTKEYLESLDSITKVNEIESLKLFWKGKEAGFKSLDCLVQPHFGSITPSKKTAELAEKIIVENGGDRELATSYNKINELPLIYSSIHHNLINEFFGLGTLPGKLHYKRLTGGKKLDGWMVWTNCKTNKALEELCSVWNGHPQLSKEYHVEALNGNITTNKGAEPVVKKMLKKSKDEGKGLIILCKHMAQRSFSISEIEGILFYTDSSSESTTSQKLSRCLTPGNRLNGNPKENAYIFHLSFLGEDDSMILPYLHHSMAKQVQGKKNFESAVKQVFDTIDYSSLDEMMLNPVEGFTQDRYQRFLNSLKESAKGVLYDVQRDVLNSDESLMFDLYQVAITAGVISKENSNYSENSFKKLIKDARATQKEKLNKPSKKQKDPTLMEVMKFITHITTQEFINIASTYCVENKKTLNNVVNVVSFQKMVKEVLESTESCHRFLKPLGVEKENSKKIMSKIVQLMDEMNKRYAYYQYQDSRLNQVVNNYNQMEIDSKEALNNLIFNSNYRKKTFGEVLTPFSLINEKLDKLEECRPGVYSNSEETFLDNSCGTGNYLVCLYQRLMKSLAVWQPDEKKRREHILCKMIYAVDIQPRNAWFTEWFLDPKGEFTGKLHVACANSLKFGYWGMKGKIGVILGNPPYQKQVGPKKTEPIWDDFILKAFELLSKNGYLCYVHPSGWRNVTGRFRKIKESLTSRSILYLEMHNEKDGLKILGAETRYDWSIIQNSTGEFKNSVVKFEDGVTKTLSLSSLPFIPNGMIEQVLRLVASTNEEKCQVLYDRTEYGTDKKNVNKEKINNFKYPVVYTVANGDKINFWYSSEKKGHFDIPKLIWSNGRISSIGTIIDDKGEYGLTQFSYGLVESPKNLPLVKKAFDSEKFRTLISMCSVGELSINDDVLSTFRKDFWREFVDEN